MRVGPYKSCAKRKDELHHKNNTFLDARVQKGEGREAVPNYQDKDEGREPDMGQVNKADQRRAERRELFYCPPHHTKIRVNERMKERWL